LDAEKFKITYSVLWQCRLETSLAMLQLNLLECSN